LAGLLASIVPLPARQLSGAGELSGLPVFMASSGDEMTDIFLSYTEKDRAQAGRLATMLESVGWTVWWDRRIPAGDTWRNVLEKALTNTRCMIVLWSARSIESEWVYEEATEGRRLGKLVPVMIEAVRPPAGFREIQAADLTNWDGSREFEGLRLLLADLENLMGKPVSAATGLPVTTIVTPARDSGPAYDPTDRAGRVTTTPWWRQPRVAALAVAGLVLLAAGITYFSRSEPEPTLVRPLRGTEPQQVSPVTAPMEAKPAPISTEPGTPPIAKIPPKARLPVKPIEAPRTTSARCANLLAKIQLGESLSYEAQAVFQKECQQ
jgi:hypothetical protein